jgi:tetratricopeptide (TPR) repeat protein
MKPENLERLKEAKISTEQKDYPEALRLINKVLDDDPNCAQALYMLGFVALEEERFGLARTVLKRALELQPERSEIWNAYGRTFQEGHDLTEAERAYQMAMALDPRNEHPYVNLAVQFNVQGQPKKAQALLEKGINLKSNPQALYNRGLSKLLQRNWEGWNDYEEVLGRTKDRKERVYCDPMEPRWDGTKGLTIVAYGEQGLGDEITFASCLPELIKDSKKVIIETERRLVNLFQRSFPEADVYGTRFQSEDIDWLERYDIDARVAFGSLPKFYRTTNAAFPGEPYLVSDPERRIQWRALLSALGDRPRIGIAWTGGTKPTGRDRRSLKLEQLLPLLKQDATFISLEYKEEREEEVKAFEKNHGIKIHHWDRATVSDKYFDYDETAALVSELDMVIGVTTASLHLAGAIGVKTWALVPEWPTWLWGIEGTTIPWNKSTTLYRQRGTWDSLIARVAHDFKNLCWDGSEATSSLQRPATVDSQTCEVMQLHRSAAALSAVRENFQT